MSSSCLHAKSGDRGAATASSVAEAAASLPPWAQDVAYKARRQHTGTSHDLCASDIVTLAPAPVEDLTDFISSLIISTSSNKMHSNTMILVSVGIIAMLMVLSTPVSAVPPPQCAPSVLMNADAKYRQICLVLSQLQNALEGPVDDRVSDPFEPIDTGIKRKDVDHVFLRFGRPRM